MLRVVVAIVVLAGRVAFAQAPEPAGKHPRILLDDTLRAAWKSQAPAGEKSEGAVGKAITRCELTRSNPKEYQRDSYMGFDWGASLSACLVAWSARGNDADAKSAVGFVEALLDDLEYIGDKKGGEAAVRRDTGYAIRSMPVYVALAYDWLHEHPAMTPALRQRIRERLEQWVSWYRKSGYHNKTIATNYHAGYVIAATMTAIALGGEAGAFGTSLWSHVRDDIWGTDMARGLAPGGLFDGGDFPEGWQYAPLSVAEYALTARVAGQHGLKIDGADRWLTALFVRTMHARSGARDTIAAIGDTDEKAPTIAVNALTLLAVLVGPSAEIAQKQAAAEKARLSLIAKDYFLYEALASARAVTPGAPALDKWPTAYYTAGLKTFYARTSWAKDGVWMATICTAAPNENADHMAPAAGNLLVTRGTDEVIVDPSPYASWSTLTGNAPTVDSRQHLPNYRPSQALWGETTHFVWAQQTASGVVATRCDYADQYKFQDHSTDIGLATRDFVLIPWGAKRADASIVVIDRGETAGADYQMYLRFRSPIAFALAGDVAKAKVGGSTVAIHKVAAAGKPETRAPKVGDCYDMDKGKCDTARFPVGEYRIAIPGPAPEAIHVVDVSGGDPLTVETLAPGITHLHRGTQDAYVSAKPGSYSVSPSAGAIHVVSDGAKLAVTKDGAKCKVEVTADAAQRDPVIAIVDAQCKATDDARTGPAAPDLAGSAAGTLIPVGGVPQRSKARGGCCSASGGAGSSMLGILVVARLRRRRRR